MDPSQEWDADFIFQNAVLDVRVPASPISRDFVAGVDGAEGVESHEGGEVGGGYSNTKEEEEWIRKVMECRKREGSAFYDEKLSFYLVLSIPSPSPSSSTPEIMDSSSSSAPQALQTLLTCLQLSLDFSYIDPAPPPVPPRETQPVSIVIPSSSNKSLNLNLSAKGTGGVFIEGPMTPNPTPATTRDGALYASSEGISVFSHAFEVGVTEDPDLEDPAGAEEEGEGVAKGVQGGSNVGKRLRTKSSFSSLISLKGHEGKRSELRRGKDFGMAKVGDEWVAVWHLEGPVAFAQTGFSEPLLSLTVTLTFRPPPPPINVTANHSLSSTPKLTQGSSPTSLASSPVPGSSSPTQRRSSTTPALPAVALRQKLIAAEAVKKGGSRPGPPVRSATTGTGIGMGREDEEKRKKRIEEDEDFMLDALAEINLLDGLEPSLISTSSSISSSYEIPYLPSSRLPSSIIASSFAVPPTVPSNFASHKRSHSRRPSQLHLRSHSYSHSRRPSENPNNRVPQPPPEDLPALRRSFRHVMTVKSAISVRMRSVAVASPAVLAPTYSGQDMTGDTDDDSLILSIEVDNNTYTGFGFLVEEVSVKVGGGPGGSIAGGSVNGSVGAKRFNSSSGAADVKLISAPWQGEGETDRLTSFPIKLDAVAQHNLLYSVTFRDDLAAAMFDEPDSAGLAGSGGGGDLPPPTPISVTSNPSQLFRQGMGMGPQVHQTVKMDDGAGMGDGGEKARVWERERMIRTMQVVNTKDVCIEVRGRPVRLDGMTGGSNCSNVDEGGYAVDGEPSTTSGQIRTSEATFDSPCESFTSRWNSKLDVTPLAIQAASRRSSYAAPSVALSKRDSSGSSFMGSHSKRLSSPEPVAMPRPAIPKADGIAGSKRHTVTGLASFRDADGGSVRGHARTASKNRRSLFTPAVGPRKGSLPSGSFPGAVGSPRHPDGRHSLPVNSHFPHPPFPGTSSIARTNSPLQYQTGPAATPAYPPYVNGRTSTVDVDAFRSGQQTSSNSGIALEASRAGTQGEVWAAAFQNGNGRRSMSLSGMEGPGGQPKVYQGAGVDGDGDDGDGAQGVLVSIALVPLRQGGKTNAIATSDDALPPSDPIDDSEPSAPLSNGLSDSIPSTPQSVKRAPRIRLLDIFLIEVFVLNKSDFIRSFVVGTPRRKQSSKTPLLADLARMSRTQRCRTPHATLVPLENNVKIGPLLPDTCQSVRLRYLALSPGVHIIDELGLIDVESGQETRLRNAMSIIVEEA